MKNEGLSPNLQDLACRFIGQDARPNNVSVATAIIATTEPRQLKGVLENAYHEYSDSVDNVHATNPGPLWNEYVVELEALRTHHGRMLGDVEAEIAAAAEAYGPDAIDVPDQSLMELWTREVKLQDNKPEENPQLVELLKKAEEAEAEHILARASFETTKITHALAKEIDAGIHKLSRRGRMACFFAGIVLGTIVGIGAIMAQTASRDDKFSAPGQTTSQDEKDSRVKVLVGSEFAGATIGFVTGEILSRRFARRRARDLMWPIRET